MSMIEVDGSFGEGGGQILRSALSLSMITSQPFRIKNIRAARDRPGLLRQHLTAVRASKEISNAEVTGDELGSQSLEFRPGDIVPGNYDFRVGSAGSAMLVFQTVLPALASQLIPSTVRFEGGTHNMAAPPYEFVERSFVPLIKRMGFKVSVDLHRTGFYPAGGGAFEATMSRAPKLTPIELMEKGAIKSQKAEALFANLDVNIAKRELKAARRAMDFSEEETIVRERKEASGPGNVLLYTFEFEHLTEVFAGFGVKGVTAENVAKRAAGNAKRLLRSGAAVGPHLADQLLIPMALAGGGSFTTLRPSLHLQTNAEVIGKFLDCGIRIDEIDGGVWSVRVC